MSMNMVQLNNNAFIVQSHVGQVIMSTTLDSEAKVKQYYGGSSWTKIEGRFLLGASGSYGVKSTGGEATHKLTVSEMPSHGHNVSIFNVNAGTTDYYKQYTSDGVTMTTKNSGIGLNGSYIYGWSNANKSAGSGFGDTAGNAKTMGGSAAHNNMPPYYAVYIWVRTA